MGSALQHIATVAKALGVGRHYLLGLVALGEIPHVRGPHNARLITVDDARRVVVAPPDPAEHYTIPQAAARLGCTTSLLWSRIARGVLPCVPSARTAPGKARWYILRSIIDGIGHIEATPGVPLPGGNPGGKRGRTTFASHAAKAEPVETWPEGEPLPERPKTRGDCLAGGCNAERPCPWLGCRHHLATTETRGRRIVVDPRFWSDSMPDTCALDVAERGVHRLEQVGRAIGCTRERVRQIEGTAFLNVRAGKRSEDWLPDEPPLPPGEKCRRGYNADQASERAVLQGVVSGYGTCAGQAPGRPRGAQ